MNRKIGETLDYIGYKLRVDKNEGNNCEGCFFSEYGFECAYEEVMSETGNCDNVVFTNIEKK